MKPLRPYRPPSNRPSPDMPVLLKAEARELLTHWELTKDKAFVDARLATVDRRYARKGAEQDVRHYMREIRRSERHAG